MSRLLAPLLAVLLAACAHNPIDPYAPADAHAALTGQGAWRLLQATRSDGRRIDALFPPAANVRLQFVDDRLTVHGGCNTLMGRFSVRAHTVAVADLAGTRMACEAPLMQVDDEIARLLSKPLSMRWMADHARMTLHADDGSTLLFEAIPLE